MTHKLSATDGNTSDRANTEPKSELAQPHPSNTEQLDKALDSFYDFLVPNPEELEYGDPTYSQELGMEFNQLRAAIATHTAEAVRAARVEELEVMEVAGTSYGFGQTFAVDGKYIHDRLAQLNNEKGDV